MTTDKERKATNGWIAKVSTIGGIVVALPFVWTALTNFVAMTEAPKQVQDLRAEVQVIKEEDQQFQTEVRQDLKQIKHAVGIHTTAVNTSTNSFE